MKHNLQLESGNAAAHRLSRRFSTNANSHPQNQEFKFIYDTQPMHNIDSVNIRNNHSYADGEEIVQKNRGRNRKMSDQKLSSNSKPLYEEKQFGKDQNPYRNSNDNLLNPNNNLTNNDCNSSVADNFIDFSHFENLMGESIVSDILMSKNAEFKNKIMEKLRKCIYSVHIFKQQKQILVMNQLKIMNQVREQLMKTEKEMHHKMTTFIHKTQRHFREQVLQKWKQGQQNNRRQHQNKQLSVAKNQIHYMSIKIHELEIQNKELRASLNNNQAITELQVQKQKQKQKYLKIMGRLSYQVQNFEKQLAEIRNQEKYREQKLMKWEQQLHQKELHLKSQCNRLQKYESEIHEKQKIQAAKINRNKFEQNQNDQSYFQLPDNFIVHEGNSDEQESKEVFQDYFAENQTNNRKNQHIYEIQKHQIRSSIKQNHQSSPNKSLKQQSPQHGNKALEGNNSSAKIKFRNIYQSYNPKHTGSALNGDVQSPKKKKNSIFRRQSIKTTVQAQIKTQNNRNSPRFSNDTYARANDKSARSGRSKKQYISEISNGTRHKDRSFPHGQISVLNGRLNIIQESMNDDLRQLGYRF